MRAAADLRTKAAGKLAAAEAAEEKSAVRLQAALEDYNTKGAAVEAAGVVLAACEADLAFQKTRLAAMVPRAASSPAEAVSVLSTVPFESRAAGDGVTQAFNLFQNIRTFITEQPQLFEQHVPLFREQMAAPPPVSASRAPPPPESGTVLGGVSGGTATPNGVVEVTAIATAVPSSGGDGDEGMRDSAKRDVSALATAALKRRSGKKQKAKKKGLQVRPSDPDDGELDLGSGSAEDEGSAPE